jgi:two-component system phosphate regulon sensor histidine kinase PhoR
VEGSVTLRIEEGEGNAIAIVEDTGIGIASDQVDRIFERFYRVDSARSKAPGTGLGLSIVKHIVESHGGSVEVRSSLNQGSTFIVRLPIA